MKTLLDINEFLNFDNDIELETFFEDIINEKEIDEASGDKAIKATKLAKKGADVFSKRLDNIKLKRGKYAERIKSNYTKKIERLKKLGKKDEADKAKKDMTRKLERMHDSADVAELATKRKRDKLRGGVDNLSKVKNKETAKRNKTYK